MLLGITIVYLLKSKHDQSWKTNFNQKNNLCSLFYSKVKDKWGRKFVKIQE